MSITTFNSDRITEEIYDTQLAINAYYADAKRDKRVINQRERGLVDGLKDKIERLERRGLVIDQLPWMGSM